MPPRKSNVSVVSANGEPAGGAATGTPSGKEKEKKDKDKDEIAIEDLTMPRTMIQRLAKGVLPEGTPLQRDAVTALCKAATVFVSHIAGAAADECALANRRTVNPADVFAALRETEHTAMIPRLEQELAKWIEVGTSKRNEYRRKMKEKEDGDGEGGGGEQGGEGQGAKGEKDAEQAADGSKAENLSGNDGPRSAKRVKGADGAAAAPGEEGDDMDVDDEEGEDGEDEEDEDDEGEEENDDEDDDETEEADDDEVDADTDPAAAQLARENRAIHEVQSDEESD